MAAEEENNKKNEGKGFAGLSSLVSDVDTTPPPPAPKTESAGSTTSTGRPAAQTAQPQPQQPTQRQTYQEPPQPSSGSSGGKWLLGIAAVVGLLWLIGQSNKPTSSPTPAYSPPAQSAAPSYSPPAQPQAPSVPQESKPPVGQDLVFSTAQIQYCLAEDIRMEGAKAALNNYSDSDVDRFNAMVADYNSRCGSFRYRSGALESARRDVEPYRSQLQAEGRSRFARNPSTGSLSAPAPAPAAAPARPAPDGTIQAMQRKLNELGYDAGSADGLMGTKTRSAIVAFQRDSGLSSDGRASVDLLAKLNSAATSTATSNRSRPNRSESSFPNVALPAPSALPSQSTQSSSPTRDAENFRTCISGDYPSLCKHNLLTPSEATQVAAAERRANFQTCISGDYPSLCKHNLLTTNEAAQVAAAERRANFQTCISGDYPSLCKHSLLNAEEAARVAEAERRARSRL